MSQKYKRYYKNGKKRCQSTTKGKNTQIQLTTEWYESGQKKLERTYEYKRNFNPIRKEYLKEWNEDGSVKE